MNNEYHPLMKLILLMLFLTLLVFPVQLANSNPIDSSAIEKFNFFIAFNIDASGKPLPVTDTSMYNHCTIYYGDKGLLGYSYIKGYINKEDYQLYLDNNYSGKLKVYTSKNLVNTSSLDVSEVRLIELD